MAFWINRGQVREDSGWTTLRKVTAARQCLWAHVMLPMVVPPKPPALPIVLLWLVLLLLQMFFHFTVPLLPCRSKKEAQVPTRHYDDYTVS